MNTEERAELIESLQSKAAYIRKRICEAANRIGTTMHVGGPLSATDVAVALYYKYLGFDPERLDDPDRNKFILSKGHNGVLLYNILTDLGLYDWTHIFEGYNVPGQPFGMHPNRKYIRGIEASTGSLGHGLPLGLGMAIANRIDQRASRIYVMVGDGELQEGSNWEAIMYAGSHQINNLVCIVDNNRGSVAFEYDENLHYDISAAFEAFGWEAAEINGNDMGQVVDTFEKLTAIPVDTTSKPTVIVSNTLKGYGVDFMMDAPRWKWHLGMINDERLAQAIDSIDRGLAEKAAR
ncbi:MAG: 1-deoxy-D-xylulose-5-phosphate synthase N-terminal domain-containing protein [Propionicimonas sp.]|uniref:transketolase n=1 Tax=Propionicimonas sp. TaxID=1955623 RepID=UPI002B208FFC|nr:1-deoxy-D-xylulose-5-phosphate synthase N-terminal domain-containing protein [Propionicimonas sp.]MEA4945683.1 1-deoxy-D-xylulose-5-phosphate synthase N-terminal domain-containing protein [Propionicimonas sp.]